MTPEIPAELLARAKAGEPAALSDVLARHERALLAMVASRFDAGLRGRMEPADVVQEAMTHAARRFPEWCAQTTYPLHVWLRLLTSQSLAEARRRHVGAQMRDARREVGPGAVSTADAVDLLVASQTSPTQAARREETRSRVLAAVDELEPLDREILALRHFEGLSNDEAARELGIEPGAASKRYVRALQRLRPALGRLAGDSGG